jgi:uncharacterized metal-binding protein YceD (DUF177 family)
VTQPEWSYRVPLDRIGREAVRHDLVASEADCHALARRFGLIALADVHADWTLHLDAIGPFLDGRVSALATQACVATGDPVVQAISTTATIRFVAADGAAQDEIELSADDCDEMEHDGQAIDLGEAAAQTLMLALDPYPRSPGADAALKAAGVLGEGETGPFAALKGLLADRP